MSYLSMVAMRIGRGRAHGCPPPMARPTTLRFIIALVWQAGRWSLAGTDPAASMHHFTCACDRHSALGMNELLDQQGGRRNEPWNSYNSENLTEGKIPPC
jgi:hypothetical protein